MRHAASTSVACIILATKVIKTFHEELADLSTKSDHVIQYILFISCISLPLEWPSNQLTINVKSMNQVLKVFLEIELLQTTSVVLKIG